MRRTTSIKRPSMNKLPKERLLAKPRGANREASHPVHRENLQVGLQDAVSGKPGRPVEGKE